MKIICESKLEMCLNKTWVDFYIIWRERKENHFHYILIFNAPPPFENVTPLRGVKKGF